MSARGREGLGARIRQLRGATPAADKPAAGAGDNPDATRLDRVEARVAHLEQLLEGLQDSVYRESERTGRLIAELQAQIQPSAISAALSKDARDRGL